MPFLFLSGGYKNIERGIYTDCNQIWLNLIREGYSQTIYLILDELASHQSDQDANVVRLDHALPIPKTRQTSSNQYPFHLQIHLDHQLLCQCSALSQIVG